MRLLDCVIVAQALQVANDEDLFPMLSSKQCVSVRPKLVEHVFFGDPYQLTANTGSQLPGPYYNTQWFSFL